MLPNLVKFHTAWIAAKKPSNPRAPEKLSHVAKLLGVGGPSLIGGLELVVLVSVIKKNLIGTGSDLWNWFQNSNQN
jgi:hypothetical protein